MIENTKKNIESGAAVESFRNEVVQRMDKPMPVEQRMMQTIDDSFPINIKNILKDQ